MTIARASKPLVSVGLPTYNRVACLERALQSALTQDYDAIEFIVSDNASDDGTKAFCDGVAARDPRVKYLRQPSNCGATANFRAVLAQARGEFFMWLGDDDWMDPSYVSQCVAVLATDPGYSLVSGFDRYYVDGKVDRDGPRLSLEGQSRNDRVVSYFRQVAMNGVFYGLMRRSVVAQIPLLDILGGDWLLVAALAFLGKLKTLDSVCINRSGQGVSSDLSALASRFPLSAFQRSNPFLTIATSAFADIGWSSPVYAPLGRVRRIALAAQVFQAILRRFYSPGHVLRMARQFSSIRGS